MLFMATLLLVDISIKIRHDTIHWDILRIYKPMLPKCPYPQAVAQRKLDISPTSHAWPVLLNARPYTVHHMGI